MAKTVDKHINIWVNGNQVENNMKSIQQAIKHVTNQLRLSTIGSKEYIEASKKLKDLKSIYDEHVKDLKTVNQSLDDNKKKQRDMVMALGGAAAMMQTASGAVQKFVGATQEYVEAYAAMDDAMSAVQKTTGMTRDEVEQLNEQLKKVDTRTSQEELLKIAEIGGRLGLAKEDIEAFTKSVDVANVALGDSFGDGAEEIATVLGKIRGAFNQTKDADISDAFNSIGSALNSVGATCAATEGNVAQFAQRMGALPDAMKPSIQDAIGLGAAFENASINAEVAATAFGQLMTKAAANIDTFAAVMKKPVDEVRDLLNTNPTEFMLQFAASFKGVPADQLGAKLKDLKLNAVGVQEAIGAMSGQTDEFRRIIGVSNQAFAEGTSMMEEFGTVNNNAAAQLEKAKKKMEEAKVMMGEKLIPVLTKAYNIVGTGSGFISRNLSLIKLIAVALGSYIALMSRAVIVEKALVSWTKVKNTLLLIQQKTLAAVALVTNTFSLASAKLTGNTLKAAQAQKALNAAMKANPFGIILTVVTALAAAFSKIAANASEAAKTEKEFLKQAKEAYIEEETRIQSLKAIIDSETTSRDEKLEAIKRLQEIIPDYYAELDEEGRIINENKKAIDDYLISYKKKLVLQAKEETYNAYQKKAQEYRTSSNEEINAYDNGNYWTRSGIRIKRAFKGIGSLFGLSYQNESWAKYWEKKAEDYYENELKPMITENVSAAIQNSVGDDTGTDGETGEETEKGNDNFNKKRENFKKEISDFFKEIGNITASEYLKARADIDSKINGYIQKAAELGLSDKYGQALLVAKEKMFQKLSDDTLKKYTDISLEIAKNIDSLSGTEYANELEKRIADNNEKLSALSEKAKENRDNILALYNDMFGSGASPEEMKNVIAALYKANDDINSIDNAKIASNAKIIGDFYKQIEDFAKSHEKEMAQASELSGKTEEERAAIQRDWKIKQLEEEYDAQIRLAEAALEAKKALNDADEETIGKMQEVIDKLKELKDKIPSFVDSQEQTSIANNGKYRASVWSELLTIDWDSFVNNWESNLARMTDALNELKTAAFDVFSSISTIQANKSQEELDNFTEAQEEKAKVLQRQLNDGVISQKYYDAQIAKMEEEKEAKEKETQREQFEREKKASLVEAAIAGALSIVKCFELGPIAGAISAAIVGVTTAAQIAAIASQANPYARGGFINQKQLALMGEEGREWVASNTLLTDKTTAPIIAALEEYQRGNKKALQLLAPTTPNWKSLSQSAKSIFSNFASNKTPVVNNYYSTNSSDNELLNEIKQMNQYLSDPENRRAYISHKLMVEDTENREFIKKQAKI